MDLAATYFLRQRLSDFVQLTGDYRDADYGRLERRQAADECVDRTRGLFRQRISGATGAPSAVQTERATGNSTSDAIN